MFLFAVTRQPIPGRIDAPSVRQFSMGPWVVTVATDEWLSSADAGPAEVGVVEAPPFAAGDAALRSAEVRFLGNEPSVEVTRTLLGGRPVFYYASPGGDFLCSTHIRLLQAAGVRLEEDAGRLSELFLYLYVTAPRTLYRGIDQLLAGQRLRFAFDGATWRLKSSEHYVPPRPEAAANALARRPEYADRTREALQRAMRPLAAGNVKPHVLLSGGLDSSLLFKMSRDELGVTDSYSTGYPFEAEEQDVEKRYALTAAEALGSRHRFFVPTTRQFLRGVLEAVSAAEQPVVLLQSVLLLLLFRDGLLARRGTVVLGQGADGVFGLKMHRLVGRVDRFRAAHPKLSLAFNPALWAALRPLMSLRTVDSMVRRGFARLGRDASVVGILGRRWGPGVPLDDPRHVLWRLGVTADEKWVRRRFQDPRDGVIASRAGTVEPFADRSTLDALSLLDFLSDVAATQSVWSKLAESAGKAVYYPFNAPAVLDAAFSTPWDVKLAEPKGLLRDVARKVGVPEFIITRPKAGFVVSASRWGARGAAFEPLVPLAAKVWGEKELRRMQSSDWCTAFTFWTMVNYALWRRLFIDGEPLDALIEELERSIAETGHAGDEAQEAMEPAPAGF